MNLGQKGKYLKRADVSHSGQTSKKSLNQDLLHLPYNIPPDEGDYGERQHRDPRNLNLQSDNQQSGGDLQKILDVDKQSMKIDSEIIKSIASQQSDDEGKAAGKNQNKRKMNKT